MKLITGQEGIEAVYQDWQNGEISGEEAIRKFALNLEAVDEHLEPWKATREVIRAHLSEVVERQGGQVELPGYGKFQIRNATVTKSYDSKALDQLIIQLAMDGHVELAQAIGTCKKESSRTGGLVITRKGDKNE